MSKRNRVTMAVCAVLAAVILWGTGRLAVRRMPKLRAFVAAKYGHRMAIGGAVLDMRGADLSHLDLRGFDLMSVCLDEADLRGADLWGARVLWVEVARYDRHTRWPAGFDPRAHGAVLVR